MISFTTAECMTAYADLAEFLVDNFNQPDLEALRAIFAVCHSQYEKDEPVWLFVIGASSSGKTAIAINCVSALGNVQVMGDMTAKALLTGTKDGVEHSILNQVGSGILAFKDFTTIISQRDEDKRVIAAQLREVYDGSFRRQTGQRDASWSGKITVIAACTPAIERAWGLSRELGERFLQVRWNSPSDPLETARKARQQKGKEKEIATRMRYLTQKFFGNADFVGTADPDFPDELSDRVDHLATCVARLRAHVIRDSHGKRDIIEASTFEEPPRLAKSLSTIALHHAHLFRRPVVTKEDVGVALRVGLDSIPQSRARIVKNLPLDASLPASTLKHFAQVPPGTIDWNAQELSALGVIEISSDALEDDHYRFTPEFVALWKVARGLESAI
jgi:hypothetical protein